MAMRLRAECDAYEPEDFEPEDSGWAQQEVHIEIYAEIERQVSYNLHREALHQLTQPSTCWSLVSYMLSHSRVPLEAQPNMIHKITDSIRSISSQTHNKYRKTIPLVIMLSVQLQHILTTTSVQAQDQDQHLCVICMDEIEVGSEAARMPCSHVYHETCITRWLNNNNRCPLCRFQTQSQSLYV